MRPHDVELRPRTDACSHAVADDPSADAAADARSDAAPVRQPYADASDARADTCAHDLMATDSNSDARADNLSVANARANAAAVARSDASSHARADDLADAVPEPRADPDAVVYCKLRMDPHRELRRRDADRRLHCVPAPRAHG